MNRCQCRCARRPVARAATQRVQVTVSQPSQRDRHAWRKAAAAWPRDCASSSSRSAGRRMEGSAWPGLTLPTTVGSPRRRPARSGEEVADQDGGGDEASEDEEIDTVNRIMGFLRSEYGEGEDPA